MTLFVFIINVVEDSVTIIDFVMHLLLFLCAHLLYGTTPIIIVMLILFRVTICVSGGFRSSFGCSRNRSFIITGLV